MEIIITEQKKMLLNVRLNARKQRDVGGLTLMMKRIAGSRQSGGMRNPIQVVYLDLKSVEKLVLNMKQITVETL